MLFDNFYGTYIPGEVAVYSGMQATAIALGDIATASDEKKETLKNEMMKAMIVNNLSLIKDSDLAVFYSYSTDYYDISSWNVPSPVESVGFLPTYTSSWTVLLILKVQMFWLTWRKFLTCQKRNSGKRMPSIPL